MNRVFSVGLAVLIASMAASGGAYDPSAGARVYAAPAPARVLIKARDFLFDPKEVTVRAGDLTFEIKNEGAIEHNFIIEDAARKALAEIAIIDAGKTAEVKVALRAGTYPFVCTLPGHREAGMQGTLRVQP
jgi:uncharacterized cupredoxin-like copper-binding protein